MVSVVVGLLVFLLGLALIGIIIDVVQGNGADTVLSLLYLLLLLPLLIGILVFIVAIPWVGFAGGDMFLTKFLERFPNSKKYYRILFFIFSVLFIISILSKVKSIYSSEVMDVDIFNVDNLQELLKITDNYLTIEISDLLFLSIGVIIFFINLFLKKDKRDHLILTLPNVVIIGYISAGHFFNLPSTWPIIGIIVYQICFILGMYDGDLNKRSIIKSKIKIKIPKSLQSSVLLLGILLIGLLCLHLPVSIWLAGTDGIMSGFEQLIIWNDDCTDCPHDLVRLLVIIIQFLSMIMYVIGLGVMFLFGFVAAGLVSQFITKQKHKK